MSWKHVSGVVFDIETVATSNNACIMSIGACHVDVDNGIIDDHFKINLSIQDGLALGLEKSKSTMEWWQGQAPEVLRGLLKNPVPYNEGIIEFSAYLDKYRNQKLWAWGPHFDVAIFNSSFFAVCGNDAVTPYRYGDVCDVRTIKNVFLQDITRSSNAHDPLQDAIDQANYLIDFFKGLEND